MRHRNEHGRHGRGHRHGRHHGRRRGFGPWSWQGRFFERGELPLALLSLLGDGPRHGYELMKALEARSGGLYEASAGSVYPILQQLQDQGLISGTEADGGRRTYALTPDGQHHLADEQAAVDAIWARAEEDEWTGWSEAAHHEAAAISHPAFRLMRAAMGSVAHSSDPARADQVRSILRDAERRIRDLDVDEA